MLGEEQCHPIVIAQEGGIYPPDTWIFGVYFLQKALVVFNGVADMIGIGELNVDCLDGGPWKGMQDGIGGKQFKGKGNPDAAGGDEGKKAAALGSSDAKVFAGCKPNGVVSPEVAAHEAVILSAMMAITMMGKPATRCVAKKALEGDSSVSFGIH